MTINPLRILSYFINKHYSGNNRIDDISYGKKIDQKYDEFPSQDLNAPLVIFWHGGSWKYGNKSMYRFIGDRLQKWGTHAFIIGYTKYPDQTFPGFIQDAKQALKNIKATYPNRKVILMGHSAGANTALLVGLDKGKQADKVVSLACVCNLGKSWEPVFGKALKDKSYDPREQVKDAYKKTEYMLIHGRLDHIVLVRDSISLFRRLKEYNFKAKLQLVTLSEHGLILIFTFIGPFYITRHKLKKFILS